MHFHVWQNFIALPQCEDLSWFCMPPTLTPWLASSHVCTKDDLTSPDASIL